MLTTTERQRLTSVLSAMKPEARVMHIARLRAMPGKAAEVAVLEGIHQQLCFAERAASTPLEINGRYRQTAPVAPEQPRIEYPPYWTPERVRYAAMAVCATAGIVGLFAYVVIPALVALASAVVSVVAVVAPWIAGGILAFIVLRSAFFGEKKTDSFPGEIPRGSSSGNVYNVYVGEGQVHVHQGGRNP